DQRDDALRPRRDAARARRPSAAAARPAGRLRRLRDVRPARVPDGGDEARGAPDAARGQPAHDRRLATAARQLSARRGVLGDAGRGDGFDRAALRRRRRQRHARGRAHPAPVGRADAGGRRARTALPHDPRRRQDPRRARRALQRRESLGVNQSLPDRRAPEPCEGAPTANQKNSATGLAGRIDRAEGRHLLTGAPLLEVGARASEARFARWPDNVVTFVIDSNPNYTNVCVTDCQFCAFYRKPGDREAWTLTVAEVLSTRVRTRIAPKKGGPEAWLEVHREAHRRGFKSTATMMYGHVETVDDLLDHFDAIRELQDEFAGFTAFVPWSFKPGNTLL